MSDFDNSKKQVLSSLYVTSLQYQQNITIQNTVTSLRGENANYLQIMYPPNSRSDIRYNGISFTPTNIYIFGILHTNVKGLTEAGMPNMDPAIVGELVIEHTDANNNSLYVCIFIKSGTETDNIVKSIMANFVNSNANTATVTQFLPSDITNSSNGFTYSSEGNKVVVLITDRFVTVSNNVANTIKTYQRYYNPLFNISPPNSADTLVNGKSVNTNDDQIYIDCNLTGEDRTDTIQYYAVPLNSSANSTLMQGNAMQMAMNFFLFVIIAFTAYFIIPNAYKTYVINYFFKKYMKPLDGITAYFDTGIENIPKYIAYADRLIFFYFSLIIILLIIIGSTLSNDALTLTVILLFPISVLSLSLIENKKQTDEKFLQYEDYGKVTYTAIQEIPYNPLDFLRSITGIKHFFSDGSEESKIPSTKIGLWIFVAYAILLAVTFGITVPLNQTNKISDTNFATIVTIISLFLLPFLFFLFTVITGYIGVKKYKVNSED